MGVTQVSGNSNSLHNDYDVSKIFVFGNRYESGTLKNATGGALDYKPGTLLGRVHASDELVPLASAATDGSQFPVGVLLTDVVQLAAAGTIAVRLCIEGDVVESKLIFDGSDTVETVVDARRYKDRIAADTAGIKLVDSFELTDYDNQ